MADEPKDKPSLDRAEKKALRAKIEQADMDLESAISAMVRAESRMVRAFKMWLKKTAKFRHNRRKFLTLQGEAGITKPRIIW